MSSAERTAGWRRKWKRALSGQRRQAAGTLGDLFAARRDRGPALLVPLLVLVLAAHGGLLPLVETRPGRDVAALARARGYLRKVVQMERARHVSQGLAERVAMPPPPPDPEAAVTRTLSREISTDVAKVIGRTLEVKVTGALAEEVAASLAKELAEASRNIAEGKYSREEIRKLREQFKRRAQAQAVAALRRYREKTQITHARKSVTQWYNESLSTALRARMRFELYRREHNQLWWHVFARHPCGAIRRWNYTDYRDYAYFGDKLIAVRSLLAGKYVDRGNRFGGRPLEHGWLLLPGWPGPENRQAQAILARLGEELRGADGGRRISFQQCAARYLTDFYPHRLKEMQARARKITADWKTAIELAEAYVAVMAGRPGAEGARTAQAKVLAAVKALSDALHEVWVGRRMREYVAVNRAVRSRVFRGGGREAAHRAYVDVLVEGLAPAVRDMAENEFSEGILVRTRGVDETTRQFADTVMALLRRDVERVLPAAGFEQAVFVAAENPYRSKVTGKSAAPAGDDVAADEKALAAVLAKWPAADRTYPQARARHIAEDLAAVMKRLAAAVLDRLLDDSGRLRKDIYRAAECVDYTDQAAERLKARASALAGRGQDLARLTEAGLPDSSAAMAALMFGAGSGHGASLETVVTAMQPAFLAGSAPARALRPARPGYPPPPAAWGRQTQPRLTPPFQTRRFEAIPFLANFPRLDGDLSDWGRIRPLALQPAPRGRGDPEPILVYGAWNYQGFFFGYHVRQAAHKFTHPWEFWMDRRTGKMLQDPYRSRSGGRWTVNWLRSGDHLRLLFDTLDARKERLGHPHTQEFFIFPRGSESCPDMPGAERIFRRPRDADPTQNAYGYARSVWKVFPPQPPPDQGPDGTGCYRVTRFRKDGYSVEVFLPRSLFRTPVFAPGWYLGFDCVVGTGAQPEYGLHGQVWANRENRRRTSEHNVPASRWGDLLLLGTDPHLAVQDADASAALARGLIPGHSCLLTVIDPDRNVHLTARDTVVVSAEAVGAARTGDVEVFVLKETGKNTSVFRGYVNTQPGAGRRVQGVLEVMPAQEVRFGYVDLANADGTRDVVYQLTLPVLAPIASPLAAR